MKREIKHGTRTFSLFIKNDSGGGRNKTVDSTNVTSSEKQPTETDYEKSSGPESRTKGHTVLLVRL